MTLATVAYRLASDTDFAAMFQKQPEEAIAKAGIELTADDQSILQSLAKTPANIACLVDSMILAESWAVGG